jgi:hypothetical protein
VADDDDYPDPLTASLAFHDEMSALLARNAERRARLEATDEESK